MQQDIGTFAAVKGRSLGGSSDLTLLARVRPGLVDTLDTVSHRTRVQRVLDTLHGGRMAGHEAQLLRLLSDAVERVEAIHSVRVCVFEQQGLVMLAVTFDGPWESYIRVLWERVGALLDLIFHDTENHVLAAVSSFDAWRAWAARVQVETAFFYGPAESTARDALHHRRSERVLLQAQPSLAAADLEVLRTVEPSAELAVRRALSAQNPQTPARAEPAGWPRLWQRNKYQMPAECIRQGLRGLAGLYRLADLFPPRTPDGEVLRRAALQLLLEFCQLRDAALFDEHDPKAQARFAEQLAWLFPSKGKVLQPRPVSPPPPWPYTMPDAVLSDLQGGIVRGYPCVTHGVALLLAFDGPEGAVALLEHLDPAGARPRLTLGHDDVTDGKVLANIAFSAAGLRACGLDEAALAAWPEVFRQGMAARAGLLGDVRENHPSRWQAPGAWRGLDQKPADQPCALDAVHVMLTLRCAAADDEATLAAYELHDKAHPLRDAVHGIERLQGLRILAARSLRRHYRNAAARDKVQEHFGFVDGNGQPEIELRADQPPHERVRARLGEIVLGHANAADPAPWNGSALPEDDPRRALHNGSFLVVRQYRQDVALLRRVVQQLAPTLPGQDAEAQTELAYAKLMGRQRNGEPLASREPGPTDRDLNRFDYDADTDGRQCPLAAHARRANPRPAITPGTRPAVLMRRSMSYGPRLAEGTAEGTADNLAKHTAENTTKKATKDTTKKAIKDSGEAAQAHDDIERGLLFMAYNASLSEQFETVQRWLAGGNATGIPSSQPCPLLGVPEVHGPRHHRFETTDAAGVSTVHRVALGDDKAATLDEAQTFTRLQWGLYLFAPSRSGLHWLRRRAAQAALVRASGLPLRPVPWKLARGRELLAALPRWQPGQPTADDVQTWKMALEDARAIERLDVAALWAAVRADHGGLLRTPYGTLVASRDLLHAVLDDRFRRYSVCGQRQRMQASFGDIYLGLDEGPAYRERADAVNQAIAGLSAAQAAHTFERSFAAVRRALGAIADGARASAIGVGDTRFSVTLDARELVDAALISLCNDWFGLDAFPALLQPNGQAWGWRPGQPPRYPGMFTAMSRYMFQPHPGKTVQDLGQDYGRALLAAMAQVVPKLRTRLLQSDGHSWPLARAVLGHPVHGHDDGFAASTLVGVIMGFVPTIGGATLGVLRDWAEDERFGGLRAAWLAAAAAEPSPRKLAGQIIEAAQQQASRARPMPPLIWRTVLAPHRLGGDGPQGVDLLTGDLLVLGLASGTQQSMEDGVDDGRLMFGGVRRDRTPLTGDLPPGQEDPGRGGPTHACPGYGAGLQAMHGVLAALVSWQGLAGEHLRQGPAPGIFQIDGPVRAPSRTDQARSARTRRVPASKQGAGSAPG